MKINPEFIPLIEWWEKDGKSLVMWLVVATIAVGGWYGWKGHRAAVKSAASDALVNAYTTEELEDAVAKYKGTATAGALRLRLAKSYFDAERYESALEQYEELAGAAPDGFADIPVVGKAQCLEALGRYAEAQSVFDAFAEANSKNYLTLTAQLGAARAIALGGDKTKALARLDAIKAANADDELATIRIESVIDLVKRYAKPVAPVSAAESVEVKSAATNEATKAAK